MIGRDSTMIATIANLIFHSLFRSLSIFNVLCSFSIFLNFFLQSAAIVMFTN